MSLIQKYELTDVRIDEIITRSLSRTTGTSTTLTASPSLNAHYPAKRVEVKPGNLSLYKKYGDGANTDNHDNNDENTTTTVSPIPAPKKPDNSVGTTFFPPTTNQLFWCFYIAHNGMFAYDTMGNAFVAENAFKYATIDHIRSNMPHIKMQFKRYRLSLPNFEAELVTSKVLSLSALLGLALCYDRNILYIDNRKYFEINATGYAAAPDENAAVVDVEPLEFTVIEKIRNRFCVLTVAEENSVSIVSALRLTCRDKFWKMDSLVSPLKSASYYTVAELQDIYTRLNIKQTQPLQKKMTKQDLYAAIAQNI